MEKENRSKTNEDIHYLKVYYNNYHDNINYDIDGKNRAINYTPMSIDINLGGSCRYKKTDTYSLSLTTHILNIIKTGKVVIILYSVLQPLSTHI